MTILLIVIIYLIGAILSLGRVNASFEVFKEYNSLMKETINLVRYITGLSWIGFLAGITVYFMCEKQECKFISYKAIKIWF